MNIGRLRHRVEIQTYSEVQVAEHQTTKTWTTVHTVYARLEAVAGYVTIDTKQINEKVTHKVLIRYMPYITSEHWLLMEGRRFRIRSIRNIDERDRILELLCEEDSLVLDYFEASADRAGDPLAELLS